MSTVKIRDLTQWLESQVGKEVTPVRERASYLVSKVTDALSNIRKIAVSLSEEASSGAFGSVERSKAEIAEKFGGRILGLADRVGTPEPMSYEMLLEFLGSLRRFHAELIYAGSFWIRKLDQRYKESIRKMEVNLSDLRTHGKMLEEHVDRKYKDVRKYESLLKDIETLRTVSDEILRLEGEISQAVSQMESLRATVEGLAEEKKQLERSEEFLELSKLESAVHKARREIVRLFDPLEKPVEKLLRVSEREKQGLDPTVGVALTEYVKDPVQNLCGSEVNRSELKSSLNGLQSMLEKNLLNLKDSRIRAALKSISKIRDEAHLEALRSRYSEATQVYREAARSEELKSLQLRREEIRSKLRETEEAIGKGDRTISSLQARKDELSKRLAHLKDSTENSIREVTGQLVQIDALEAAQQA